MKKIKKIFWFCFFWGLLPWLVIYAFVHEAIILTIERYKQKYEKN